MVYEMVWLKSLLIELGLSVNVPMAIYCDNQAAIFIANNPTFHELTKYIEVHCHYVHDIVMRGIISTPYTQSSEQLADILTNGLRVSVFRSLCNKLGMIDIYASA